MTGISSRISTRTPRCELADVVDMSSYHFARLFNASTGVPPHRFVVRQRIARARRVLATPEQSIAKISRLVGPEPRVTAPRCSRRVRAARQKPTAAAAVQEDRARREGG